eukprot:jgi/Ulvmu1/443/UM001_0450.1
MLYLSSHQRCHVSVAMRGRFRAPSCRRLALCAAKKAGNRKGGRANNAKADGVEKQKQLLSALVASSSEGSGEAQGTREEGSEEDMGVTLVKKGKAKKQHTEETLEGSLYSHPRIYDWAFGYRDYEQEVDFLFDVYEEVIGDEPLSFLELGCGPAQHGLEMAESKLKVFCVDMQTQMLEYAAALAAEDHLEMTCIEGDMRDFKLPPGEQVNLATCLLGTFQHLITNDDALRTLRAVHAALSPQGLFVVEMNHPMLLFDGSLVTSGDTWTIDVDEAQLEVLWGAEGDAYDAFAQVLRKTVEVTVMPRGGRQQRLRETVALRQFTFQELSMLAERAGFTVLRTYGDYGLDSRVQQGAAQASGGFKRPASAPKGEADDEPFRMILVLQKA